jgi:hypothetical protein
MCLLAVLFAVATACSPGDGEGPRYSGRVTSVSAQQVCVGPSTSSGSETCGEVPDGFSDLPQVGQCVSLFAHFSDQGQHRTWTDDSLRLRVKDSECPMAP